VNLTD